MANDNVKIIIQEVDETKPRGSGISSDIAYVPGLAYPYEMASFGESGPVYVTYSQDTIQELTAEEQEAYELVNVGNEQKYYKKLSRNVPTLCSSIEEFEAHFGKFPYVMTDRDILTSIKHTYSAGDYDKSYVYAKELINAGMSVLYENIMPPAGVPTVTNIDYIKEDHTINLVDKGNGSFIYAPVDDNEEEYKFQFVLPASPVSGGVRLDLTPPSDERVELELVEITASGSDVFSISNNIISWHFADETDFKYTTFTAKVSAKYTHSGDRTKFEFLLSAVPKDASICDDEGCVCGSRIEYLYENLDEALVALQDKNEYSVKYITSGGYPSFIEVIQDDGSRAYSYMISLLNCAKQREDAVALIDHLDDPTKPLATTSQTSVYSKVNALFGNGGIEGDEFAAMFTPWGRYLCSTAPDVNKRSQLMPASFGYLMCMAKAIKTSPNWLAMAGVTRGIVPNLTSLHTNELLNNVIAENYQPKYGTEANRVSINAITNIKPYGLTIWGNRTLMPVPPKGTRATNFLNTRNMISDIKKVAYSTAKELMFEQDSDTLWLKFKSGISPLLDQLKSGFGISDYKIIKGTTKYNGQALTRGEMAAVIKIFPLYAVEYFEITVVVADNDVVVQ